MATKNLLFALSLTLLISCSDKGKDGVSSDIIKNPSTASGDRKTDDLPVMTFTQERIEFGTINQGEKITREFEFTNTGKSDLVIETIYGACGCTVANEWPKDPVEPGESARFTVTFDSEKMVGQQVKKITVKANTYPSENVVALAGNVAGPGLSEDIK